MAKLNGRVVTTATLNNDKPSTFGGELVLREPGAYEIIVYAFDAVTGNSGVDRTTVILSK